MSEQQAMTQGDLTDEKKLRSTICKAITSFGHEITAKKIVLHRSNDIGESLLSEIVDAVASALLAAHPVQPTVLYKSGAKSPDGTYEAVPIAQPEPVVVSDAQDEASRVSAALFACDWSGVSIGNKAIIEKAAQLLASAQPTGDVRNTALEAAAIVAGRTAELCATMPDGQRVADAVRALKSQPTEHPPCPVCNGNDADMPCAYPSQGAEGCLRDARLAQPVQKPVAYMVTGNLEDLLFFDLHSAETAADMNCGTLVPLYPSLSLSQQADAEKP